MNTPLRVGILLFEGVTQLDLTGPYEILARMPNTNVSLVACGMAPVRTEWGLTILPDVSFAKSPQFDVLVVPGGWAVDAQLENAAVLEFLQQQASHAKYIASVCSGALLLGAAGLLRGYRATTHWLSLELLRHFGAEPVNARVVRDRNRITGAGVTAGIDFALAIAAEIHGAEMAQRIQLAVEYRPDPPFDSGSPEVAPAEIQSDVRASSGPYHERRRAIIERIAAGLSS